jgi:hypothetical protein
VLDTRDGATYFAARVWGVFTHYDLGGYHPLAGYSVPNFTFEDGSMVADLMHAGKALLLDFNGNEALERLSRDYSNITYVQGKPNEQLNLSALLVRPDGIVAWAANETPDDTALQAVADKYFAKTATAAQGI